MNGSESGRRGHPVPWREEVLVNHLINHLRAASNELAFAVSRIENHMVIDAKDGAIKDPRMITSCAAAMVKAKASLDTAMLIYHEDLERRMYAAIETAQALDAISKIGQ